MHIFLQFLVVAFVRIGSNQPQFNKLSLVDIVQIASTQSATKFCAHGPMKIDEITNMQIKK